MNVFYIEYVDGKGEVVTTECRATSVTTADGVMRFSGNAFEYLIPINRVVQVTGMCDE